MEEREVELIDYLRVLRKWKWLIVGGAFIAALMAVAMSVSTPKTYRATVTLLVTTSKIPPPEGGGGVATPGMSPETFEAMVRNKLIALETIHHFGLDKQSLALTPERFLRTTLAVEVHGSANLLTLTAILPDPKLAADVANFVAQKAVDLNTALNQSETVTTQNYIQHQRDTVKVALEAAQAALVDFKRTANLESLRAEQRILLDAKAELAQIYADYTIRLTGLQTAATELKTELTRHDPFLTVSKLIVSDPTMLAAAQEQGTTNLKTLSGMQLKSQEINEIYQGLQGNLIGVEATLASLQSQSQDVEQKLKDNDAKLAEIEQKIAESEARLEELTRNYTLEKGAYELFATKLNEASISVASRAAELKIVDPAIVPTQPHGLKIFVSAALAATAGLIVCVVLTFFLEYLQQAKLVKTS